MVLVAKNVDVTSGVLDSGVLDGGVLAGGVGVWLPGQKVVVIVITLVVTWPTGQLVMVWGQLVIVNVVVDSIVEVVVVCTFDVLELELELEIVCNVDGEEEEEALDEAAEEEDFDADTEEELLDD